ncbi:toprim domain-containing protein [Ornithinibacillus sp. 4-3]|uniref:Toprim domain-containing protein n=1 Tax=Ornithinibacillus sp. 4-3 TaxID=3231488 RepID=A0AB39HI98_9BACI
MWEDRLEKIIIVEGRSDKKKIEKVIIDPDVTVICTNGTLGVEQFDELLYKYELDDQDVYILVDEDKTGLKLRKQLSRELPHAKHIHVNKVYKEVATTPEKDLAIALVAKNIEVNIAYL